jgi:hypothetical protein
MDGELSGACDTHTSCSDENYIRTLDGKYEDNTWFGRSSRGWENTIKMDLGEGTGSMVDTCEQQMHFQFPKSGRFLDEMGDYSVLKKDSFVFYLRT